jgi:putative tricarboxylic transport membrane protein
MERRQAVRGLIAGFSLAALGNGARAQAAPVPGKALLPALRIYIPGGAGGGWDQTGRALGAAMQSAGLVSRVEYENKGGKGGTIGLKDFVDRYHSDPAALMVGGMVMVGAIAVNRPETTLSHVQPVARLTSDYLVLAVAPSSPLRNMKALVAAMHDGLHKIVFTGGSVGGVDHMLAGMIARQLRLDAGAVRYEPTSSGKDALALLDSGRAQVAISSYSEFKSAIAGGALRPLAVSSRNALDGMPSLREEGVYTEMSNWRAVFCPAGIGGAQTELLRELVLRALQAPAWRQALQANNWIDAPLHGKAFRDVLELEQAMAGAVTLMLKLKT